MAQPILISLTRSKRTLRILLKECKHWEKCKSYGVNNNTILSILVRKKHDVNEVIKNVNNLLRALCLEHGFTFICNNAIARTVWWHDGLHLTNEGTSMLFNQFLQYLKNVSLGNKNRIFTDWQPNQDKSEGSHQGIKEFSPKDPEVPKLSNDSNSKLKIFEMKILTMWS